MKQLLLALLLSFAFISCCRGAIRLSTSQVSALQNASRLVAQQDSSGHFDKRPAFTQIFQAILFQESSLCRTKVGLDRTSYGCGQVRQATAEFILHRHVSIYRLQHDNRFNMIVAARYLHYCLDQFTNWKRGVICYNTGKSFASRVRFPDRVRYLHYIKHRMLELGQLSPQMLGETHAVSQHCSRGHWIRSWLECGVRNQYLSREKRAQCRRRRAYRSYFTSERETS